MEGISVNVPLALTLTRLIVSPLVLPFLLVYLLPYHLGFVNSLLASFFVLLSLTDFFDGYLARKYHQETALGKLLDPIADKFLFYSTLIALVAAGKLYFYWGIILIGREFFVMGLRLVALEKQIEIPASWLAKIKTAVQMIWLMVVILNPYHQMGFMGEFRWNGTELGLLLLTLVLSLVTAYQYYQLFMGRYSLQQQMPPEWSSESSD